MMPAFKDYLRRLDRAISGEPREFPGTAPERPRMITIFTGGSAMAQGDHIRDLPDGRVVISTGRTEIAGFPVAAQDRAPSPLQFPPLWRLSLYALTTATMTFAASAHSASAQSLLNVSYDPTRELYQDYNKLFAAHWNALGHTEPLDLSVSHGGSGAQATAVINGLDAQVVTLALSADIDAVARKTSKIPKDWQSKLPHNASPYTSTIVFLVRKDNPKGIKDWDDLIKPGVQVITPNPKTSGGARWNFLAAWAWAEAQPGGNDASAAAFVKALYGNVPVLDSGARGSTVTFTERGIGDVLLAWENEAYLAVNQLGADKYQIVVPSISVRAEPPVALVDGNIHSDDQRQLAEEYVKYLYSPEAQALELKHYYRAWDTSKADPQDLARLPDLKLVGIEAFGGWDKAQPQFFGDGGVFDQIYAGQ